MLFVGGVYRSARVLCSSGAERDVDAPSTPGAGAFAPLRADTHIVPENTAAMEADEFDRKYHPFPALLNLMSETPDTSEVAHGHCSLSARPLGARRCSVLQSRWHCASELALAAAHRLTASVPRPVSEQKCVTTYDMLEPGIVDLFKEV